MDTRSSSGRRISHLQYILVRDRARGVRGGRRDRRAPIERVPADVLSPTPHPAGRYMYDKDSTRHRERAIVYIRCWHRLCGAALDKRSVAYLSVANISRTVYRETLSRTQASLGSKGETLIASQEASMRNTTDIKQVNHERAPPAAQLRVDETSSRAAAELPRDSADDHIALAHVRSASPRPFDART